MIVEFIGSTGAGKTTLISRVQRKMTQTVAVASSFDLIAAPLALSNIDHPTVRNLVQEIVGLPFFVWSLLQYKTFIIFILKMLARQPMFSIFMINNLRSLERKIGVYEIIRRRQGGQIVFVDEGTVLLAHNVFVYTGVPYSHEEIARFANLVPLPDIIVYIKAPVDVLVQRSLQRLDPPREMKSRDRKKIERQVRRAVEMFDQLIQADNIQCRLLTVENSDLKEQKYDAVVDKIVEFILTHERSSMPDAV